MTAPTDQSAQGVSTPHFPGLLAASVQIFDNDGMPETAIQSVDGSATVAVALDFGPNNPEMRQANARRLVACWNACEGIGTEALEVGAIQARIESACGELYEVKRERDALAVRVRELEADAARYQFIRAGKVYLEITSDGLYMATDTAGRYYPDLRDFDMDIDSAIDDLTTPESKP